MTIATNPETGQVVFLSPEGQWEPAQTAVNPQTKEMLAFDGREWRPVPASGGVFEAIEKAVKATPVPARELTASEVATSAVKNIPSSAVQFGKDIVQPILHPIDTAESLKNIGHGVLQKIGILSGSDQEKYADAVGQFFTDRYGGWENIKRAIATDPVGVLSDVSLVLTGGGAVAARAPGVLGKVGEVTKAVGQAVDPIQVAAGAAKVAGGTAASVIGGLGTHTGGEALRTAARAGAEGGTAGAAFRENLRGTAPIDTVVADAKAALDVMRQERGAEYTAAMAKVGQDQTVLNFNKIDQAVQDTQKVKTYKGQELSPKTLAVRSEIGQTIGEWKALSPKDFHTAEGIDALKQKIGDIRDSLQRGTPEYIVANRAYSAVRQTIVDQVPEYAKVMNAYETASDLIRDIEKTLSLNPKASVDTTVRKLQSVLQNNVNTNFGRREALANYLVRAGAPNLLTKLAGQQLSAALPRGLGKLTAAATLIGGGGAAVGGLGIPALVLAGATLPFTSPRLMGEAAHMIGRASPFAPPAAAAAFQSGRAARASEQRK